MSNKIWSTSPSFGFYAKEPVAFLEDKGYVVELVSPSSKLSEEEALATVADCAAVISGFFPITRKLMEAAPELKVVAMHGAGVNHIDVAAASERKIMVTNAPGMNRNAVAELAVGLYLSLARQIPATHIEVQQGGWPRVIGSQILGKTLGLVGLGAIGKTVAEKAMSMGMKVVAFDMMPDQAFVEKAGIQMLTLPELMASADYVSVHVPLTPDTEALVGYEELAAMKPTAYLANLSRGKVVDEEALYRILSEKKIAGAALDVFADEPPAGNPLLGLDTVITTSHMGGYTIEALTDVGMSCAQSIVDCLEGRKPEYLVNADAF